MYFNYTINTATYYFTYTNSSTKSAANTTKPIISSFIAIITVCYQNNYLN